MKQFRGYGQSNNQCKGRTDWLPWKRSAITIIRVTDTFKQIAGLGTSVTGEVSKEFGVVVVGIVIAASDYQVTYKQKLKWFVTRNIGY